MFYLFAGDHYYPSSGLGDYQGKYDTEEEAEAAGKALTRKKEYSSDWYCIITVDDDGDLREVSRGR